MYNIWMGLRKTQTNWVTSTVLKAVKLHAASGKRKREEKTRGDSPFSRWSPLVKVSLVKSSPALSINLVPRVFSHHIGKREDPGHDVGTQLSERLEKAVKCLGKKWVEVPGAHAVDITVRLLEPGHLEEDYAITFFENKGFSRILNFCWSVRKKAWESFVKKKNVVIG